MNIFKRVGFHISLVLLVVIRKARSFFSRASGRGPVSGVRIVLVTNGEVLLVRHYHAPWMWTLPGGGIDVGELPEAAAIREVKEETGLNLRSMQSIGVFSHFRGGETHVYYSSDFEGVASPTVRFEIKECGWFKLNNLPEEIFARDQGHIEKYTHIINQRT